VLSRVAQGFLANLSPPYTLDYHTSALDIHNAALRPPFTTNKHIHAPYSLGLTDDLVTSCAWKWNAFGERPERVIFKT
jgi:hypothetical protein